MKQFLRMWAEESVFWVLAIVLLIAMLGTILVFPAWVVVSLEEYVHGWYRVILWLSLMAPMGGFWSTLYRRVK